MLPLALLACAPQAPPPAADADPAAPLVVAADAVDFGAVALGCSPTRTLTLENTGGVEVTLTSVATDAVDVSVASVEGQLGFPITLSPGAVLEVALTWEPLSEGTLAADLMIEADTSLSVALAGRAAIEREATSTFVVAPLEPVTALVSLHKLVAEDPRFALALPAFFDTLLGSGAPYRVAFVTHETGVIDGASFYLDNGASTEASTAAALAMVATPDRDLDRILLALDSGLTANRGWLLDEEDWAASRLSMIGMNFDIEQSPADWRSYLGDWQELKGDAAIVVSGMGGDVPRGCGSFALPFEAFADAAEATGGAFLSICAEDWSEHFEDLARAAIGGTQFVLEGYPAASVMQVYIDGAEVTEGWSYEVDTSAIEFDRYPDAGSGVSVVYATASECPEG